VRSKNPVPGPTAEGIVERRKNSRARRRGFFARRSSFRSSLDGFVREDRSCGRMAVVLRHEDDRPGPALGLDAYFTRIDMGWFQSPMPAFVVTRYRKSTVVATGSPTMVVFAFRVFGTWIQVLPPSRLNCHS